MVPVVLESQAVLKHQQDRKVQVDHLNQNFQADLYHQRFRADLEFQMSLHHLEVH